MLDKKKAASLGFTQGDVGQAISNALRGTRVGSVTLAGEQRDIFVRSQAADEPSPSDIGNLELPVSQLQQQNAQKKASDKLADKQKALTKEQQRHSRRRYEPIRTTSCASSNPSSSRAARTAWISCARPDASWTRPAQSWQDSRRTPAASPPNPIELHLSR